MPKDQDANYKMKNSSIKADGSEHFPQGFLPTVAIPQPYKA
jgi:hypothetical protein